MRCWNLFNSKMAEHLQKVLRLIFRNIGENGVLLNWNWWYNIKSLRVFSHLGMLWTCISQVNAVFPHLGMLWRTVSQISVSDFLIGLIYFQNFSGL